MPRTLSSLFPADGLLAASQVMAQDARTADHSWHFESTPYVWGSATSGTVGIRGLPDLKVESSFSDTLSNFDFGLLGRLEHEKYDNESGASPRTVDLTLKGPLVLATVSF